MQVICSKALIWSRNLIPKSKNPSPFKGIYSLLTPNRCITASDEVLFSPPIQRIDSSHFISTKDLNQPSSLQNSRDKTFVLLSIAPFVSFSLVVVSIYIFILSYYGKVIYPTSEMRASQINIESYTQKMLSVQNAYVQNDNYLHTLLEGLDLFESAVLLTRTGNKINISELYYKAVAKIKNDSNSTFEKKNDEYSTKHRLKYNMLWKKTQTKASEVTYILSDIPPIYVFSKGLLTKSYANNENQTKSLCNKNIPHFLVMETYHDPWIHFTKKYIYFVHSSSKTLFRFESYHKESKTNVTKYVSFSSIPEYDIIGNGICHKNPELCSFGYNPNYRKKE